jgi:hypothetical protein
MKSLKSTDRVAIVLEVIENLTDLISKKAGTSINLKEDIEIGKDNGISKKISVTSAVKKLSFETVSCTDDHDLQKKMMEISTSCTYINDKVSELERLKILAKNARFEPTYSQVDIGCIAKVCISGTKDVSYILLPGGNGIITSHGVVCTLNSPIGKSIHCLKVGESAVVNGRHYEIKSIL